ncbi:type III pantothenate kinase 1 [Fusobacterium sp. CAG:439]|nr:type III pantothenate kinase 1 [Fusobacterium sp. CAG:439]HIT92150.1 type III pantothenate kinase [Candidatus Stercorousia faecigallinarum]
MLLTADIGNTSITLGLFEEDALVEEYRLASDKDLSLEEYEVLLKTLFKDFKVDGCIISSVVEELTKKLKTAVDNVFKINSIVLSTQINTGVKICLDNPEEAGADRIANAAGAYVLYSHPVIVVDFGTATTFDIVNGSGEFVGGIIAPGLNLQLKALNKFTSKLPRIEVALSNTAIGHNTTDAILSGVLRGSASMIDGLIEQCEKELGEKAVVVATGGYSGLIANYLKRPFDFINPTLTLEGLRHLYQINKLDVISKLEKVTH